MSEILVLDGHPRAGSFGAALADAYTRGAEAAGASVRRVALRDLRFDPVLHDGYAQPQALEPDLVAMQDALVAARHLTLCYPTWWGTAPALLKGFIDRTFLPGFAFRMSGGRRHEKLLAGRSARLVVTMDWPVWAWGLGQGAPGRRAMRDATLGFVGFAPVHLTELGQVRESDAARRAGWLARVEAEAARDVARLPARLLAAA